MQRPRDQSLQPRLERGVFLLLGPSGSGKGSVGAALLQRGLISAHISMGAWLREAALTPAMQELNLAPLQPDGFASPLEYLRHCVINGLLIPDAWTQTVIDARLAAAPLGRWALDGYPRTVGAAQHLTNALESADIPLLGAIHLRVSDDVAIERLLARSRTDDEMAAIAKRLEFYRSSVVPTLEWLNMRGVNVTEVAADPSLALVVGAVERVLEGWQQKARIHIRARD